MEERVAVLEVEVENLKKSKDDLDKNRLPERVTSLEAILSAWIKSHDKNAEDRQKTIESSLGEIKMDFKYFFEKLSKLPCEKQAEAIKNINKAIGVGLKFKVAVVGSLIGVLMTAAGYFVSYGEIKKSTKVLEENVQEIKQRITKIEDHQINRGVIIQNEN